MLNEATEIKGAHVHLTGDEMIELKRKTGKKNMNDAIRFAVRAFITHNEKVT